MLQLNIYIVEDEPLIARMLKQTVQCIGHRVCGTAVSFEDAVHGLTKAGADLVITDIMLEGDKTGVDLARHINKHLKIPFLFQSSVVDPELINEAMRTKPLQFMPKPLDSAALLRAIQGCL